MGNYSEYDRGWNDYSNYSEVAESSVMTLCEMAGFKFDELATVRFGRISTGGFRVMVERLGERVAYSTQHVGPINSERWGTYKNGERFTANGIQLEEKYDDFLQRMAFEMFLRAYPEFTDQD